MNAKKTMRQIEQIGKSATFVLFLGVETEHGFVNVPVKVVLENKNAALVGRIFYLSVDNRYIVPQYFGVFRIFCIFVSPNIMLYEF